MHPHGRRNIQVEPQHLLQQRRRSVFKDEDISITRWKNCAKLSKVSIDSMVQSIASGSRAPFLAGDAGEAGQANCCAACTWLCGCLSVHMAFYGRLWILIMTYGTHRTTPSTLRSGATTVACRHFA